MPLSPHSPTSPSGLPPSGAYARDILAQPEALAAAAAGLADVSPEPFTPASLARRGLRRILLTGMGSSFFCLYPLYLRLLARSRSGLLPYYLETAELIPLAETLGGPDTLLIAVSQSGESAEIVRLLSRPGLFREVLALTNQPASTLARAASSTLLLHAGPEATVSCKTYLNSLAVLHWLAAALTGEDPAAARSDLALLPASVAFYHKGWEDKVATLADLLRPVRSLFVAGRGPSLASAWTAGLTLKESTRRPAEGLSCPAFRHGPFEMTGSDLFLLAFAGDEATAPLHRRLVEDVCRAGGLAALAAFEAPASGPFLLPAVPPALAPVVEMLPVQLLSLALAWLDGREAGRFERASKVTVVD